MRQPDLDRSAIGWWVALAVVVVAAAGASPWLVDVWRQGTTSLRDRAATAPEALLARQSEAGEGRSLLVVVEAGDGSAASIAIATKAVGGDGVMALVPPSLFALLPGYGEFPVGDAVVFEDEALLGLTLENALGVRIDDVATFAAGGLAAAILEPIAVTLPASVFSADGTQVLAEAGTRLYAGSDVETMLVAPGQESPLGRIERQAAVWESILEAIAEDSALVARLGPSGAATVLTAVATSDPRVTLIPVEPTAGAGGVEGFVLDGGGLRSFVAGTMAHLALGSEARPRVEVLNGNGRVLTTRPVVNALVDAGFLVLRTDNAERFDIPETLVIAQGEDNRSAAERALRAIGRGSLRLEVASPSGVVDVSIIVGLDVPAGEG